MQIPQIKIQQTFAAIGLRTTAPKQEIEQPQAELNLQQYPAELNIHRTPSRLRIDQSQARYEVNLKDLTTLLRDAAENGKQVALEGIARRAQEGKRLAAIEQGGTPIADIAKQNRTPGPLDYTVGFVPSYGAVKLEYTPAKLEMNWNRGGVELNPVIKKPIHNYTPGQVEIYLRQKNSLSIDWVGGELDRTI